MTLPKIEIKDLEPGDMVLYRTPKGYYRVGHVVVFPRFGKVEAESLFDTETKTGFSFFHVVRLHCRKVRIQKKPLRYVRGFFLNRRASVAVDLVTRRQIICRFNFLCTKEYEGNGCSYVHMIRGNQCLI